MSERAETGREAELTVPPGLFAKEPGSFGRAPAPCLSPRREETAPP